MRANSDYIFQRYLKEELPVAKKGEGVYIVDHSGNRYLDASGGAAVSCLGHSHPKVVAAIEKQIKDFAFAHTRFFTSEPAEALAEHMITRAPEGIDRVYFVSGGSEAVEAALKLARQYFVETGELQRTRFIARRQSYHGNTLGALAVGGNQWRRLPFEPVLMDAEHVSPCYAYREQRRDESDEAYGLRVANELEDRLQQVGAESVIAFIAEPVVGATAGALTPAPGYFKRIREICDQYGIILIFDEVMCGMGRTGTLYACEQEGVVPDILVAAKGLAAGYQPIGATLCSQKIYDTIFQGSGFFQHGHTYMGHPTACAAALAVQQAIEEEGLLDNCQKMGAHLQQCLQINFSDHPCVGDIRGRGLFRGVELVADRESKTPLEPTLKVHNRIKHEAMGLGLICYPGGGTVDGKQGDHVLLAPPFIVTQAQIEEIAEKLKLAINLALATAGIAS